jgi:hypothetical protein
MNKLWMRFINWMILKLAGNRTVLINGYFYHGFVVVNPSVPFVKNCTFHSSPISGTLEDAMRQYGEVQ